MPFGTGTAVTSAGRAIITNLLAGAGTIPKWLGCGTGATAAARTAAVGDTALSSQSGSRVGTNNPTRTTTTVTNDTWNIQQTFTAASQTAVDEAGIFDASTSGNMFISATFGVVTLEANDTLTATYSVQFS